MVCSLQMSAPPKAGRTISLSLVEHLFDQIPTAPFFIKDRALRYLAANQAMAQLCGVTNREAMIGKQASDFFPAAFAQRYEALDRRVLESGKPIKDRLELSLHARARPQWLLYTRWPVHDEDGAITGVAASARTLDTPLGHHPRYEGIAAVVAEMQNQYAEPLRIADLAVRAGVSASQLQRDFIAIFNLSPQHYLAKLRLDAAMDLLRSDATIAEIAQASGYSDQGAFSRRFRTAVGVSPSEYRRSAKSFAAA